MGVELPLSQDCSDSVALDSPFAQLEQQSSTGQIKPSHQDIAMTMDALTSQPSTALPGMSSELTGKEMQYTAPIRAPVSAHLAKRATYDPRMIAPLRMKSSSETASVSDYSIHPSISAYQKAHPRRPLINFGPYILLQTLGEGEFGKVKLGVHKDYGEEVAVKLIRRGSVDTDTRLTKVEREIDVLKVQYFPPSVSLLYAEYLRYRAGCQTS